MKATRHRFDGQILGFGTRSGRRIIVGYWQRSPFGSFADVMVAHPDGTRELLAPNDFVGEYVASIYNFDVVTITAVNVLPRQNDWTVIAGPLTVDVTFGSRQFLGYLLTFVRGPLVHPLTARVASPFAQVLLPGVDTYGSAGCGKYEYYVTQDLHGLRTVSGHWDDAPLGELADVWPPPNFGFSSTPKTPTLTTVTTYVDT